jgi:hypothetical protein
VIPDAAAGNGDISVDQRRRPCEAFGREQILVDKGVDFNLDGWSNQAREGLMPIPIVNNAMASEQAIFRKALSPVG